MTPGPFSEFEKQAPTVRSLNEYYKERLAKLRARNDNAPDDQTARLRGRIAEAKYILSLCGESTDPNESNDTDI